MEPKNTLKILTYISTLPLLGAMLIALNGRFLAWGLTGEMLGFARLNAYIYAHSYGALLLCLITGMHLTELIRHQASSIWIVAYFSLLLLSWFSFKSFADFEGILMLACCWVGLLLMSQSQNRNNTNGINTLTNNTALITSTLLIALLVVNQ